MCADGAEGDCGNYERYEANSIDTKILRQVVTGSSLSGTRFGASESVIRGLLRKVDEKQDNRFGEVL